MSRLRALDLFDRLVLLGGASGTVGFGLITPPFAFLFLAGLSLALAAVIDRRTPPIVEVKP